MKHHFAQLSPIIDFPLKFLKNKCEGPEVRGTRPVLVTFENFKDRDEVLRKVSEHRTISKQQYYRNNPNPGVTRWEQFCNSGSYAEEGQCTCGRRPEQTDKRKQG